jgi:hypothetical protein
LDTYRNFMNRFLISETSVSQESMLPLEELEAGLAKRIEVDRTEKKTLASGMENWEEYFYLVIENEIEMLKGWSLFLIVNAFQAATAVRISLAVQHPHQSDPIHENTKVLFERCMQDDVPFHQVRHLSSFRIIQEEANNCSSVARMVSRRIEQENAPTRSCMLFYCFLLVF